MALLCLMPELPLYVEAYLESKSKMCIISHANTNQNLVSLSLSLVSLNAHVNVPNSSLDF